jgi:hypothetical protein
MKEKRVKKAIVVLSAGIKQDKGNNWVSTDLTEAKNLDSAPGGKVRVVAASYIYKNDSENFIIASGGQGSDKNILGIKHPGLSKILKRELIESGVPADKIIEENKSDTTFQQLLKLQEIKKSKGVERMIIISNQYHLPRIKAIIKYGSGLNVLRKMFGNSDIKLKSAENILIKFDSDKWENKIKKVYQGKAMRERITLENKGVKQIKRGTYKFK